MFLITMLINEVVVMKTDLLNYAISYKIKKNKVIITGIYIARALKKKEM